MEFLNSERKSQEGLFPPSPCQVHALGQGVSVINFQDSQKASSMKRPCTDLPLKSLSPIPRSTGCILFNSQTEAGAVGIVLVTP